MTRPSPLSPTPAPRSDLASTMRLLGLALLLIPLFTRAMSIMSMLPGWDLDPLIMPMPFTGIGPAESITIDCISLLGAAIMAVFARTALGSSVRADWVVIALLAIGAAGVHMHMRSGGWPWLPAGGGLGDRRIGIAWLSAMLGAGAIWLCRHDESLRRIAAAVLVGFVAVLALKGAQQVFIEHIATVQQYRADPGRFLASQGLLPDTPMARAFERRLLQSEATGWFGLSNVYATVLAGASVSLVGLFSLGVKHRATHRRLHRIIIGAMASVALTALFATHSKGGALAAAVGGLSLVLAALASKPLVVRRVSMHRQDARAKLGTLFGLAAVLGPIALIIIRGLIGERMGELSLLFRWFYMQGAARIFVWHPLGVGPDGFQQAYLLAKPPISPEEVTSPHNIIFDWLGDLGIFGIGWIVLLLIAAAAIGRVLLSAASPVTAPPNTASPAVTPFALSSLRAETRLILLIPGLATLLAAWLERGAVTPDGALVRLVGLLAWCAAAWGILNITRAVAAWPVALAAGAAAILAHSQIDVAASWLQSVGLIAIWVAIAGSGSNLLTNSTEATAVSHPRLRLNAGLLVALLACIAIAVSDPSRVWRWQVGLLTAKDQLVDVADLNARLGALADGSSREDPARIAADVAAALSRRETGQHQPPRNAEELQAAMARLETLALADSAELLTATAKIEPSEWRVRREASRLLLRASSAQAALGDFPAALPFSDRAIEVLGVQLPAALGAAEAVSAPEWRWLAIANLEAAKPHSVPRYFTQAAAALERAAALDPYNLEIALRLMRVYTQLGDAQDAAANAKAWANKVLELDPLMRLDRETRGLTPSERSEAEQTLRRP